MATDASEFFSSVDTLTTNEADSLSLKSLSPTSPCSGNTPCGNHQSGINTKNTWLSVKNNINYVHMHVMCGVPFLQKNWLL